MSKKLSQDFKSKAKWRFINVWQWMTRVTQRDWKNRSSIKIYRKLNIAESATLPWHYRTSIHCLCTGLSWNQWFWWSEGGENRWKTGFFSPALRGISVILCVFWQEYSLLLTLPVWFDRLIGRTINMANICSFIICKNRPIFSLPTQKKATIMTAKHPHISIKKWLLNSLDIFF